jgi:2-(1,2-epoxy-1,2-dihydrophenyl)acetyl-CoA isomerase
VPDDANQPVLYEAHDGVAVITLNRPEVLNSFTREMLSILLASLRRAGDEGQRAALITGAGRGFSAGQDLASIRPEYDSGGPDLSRLLREHFHPVLRAIRSLQMPVIAAVNGVAAGAGMSLALACDLRIAADTARFATAFTRIGLVPDAGMAYTLPRLVGEGRAKVLLLQAEPVDAASALAMGLVDKVVAASDLMAEATSMAKTLAAGPTRGYVLTRQLLETAATSTFDQLLDAEAEVQQQAGSTEDHRAAVAAFIEKRQAEFKGR